MRRIRYAQISSVAVAVFVLGGGTPALAEGAPPVTLRILLAPR